VHDVSDARRVPTEPSDFPASGPHALATLRQRLAARLIDVVIVTLPLVVVTASYLEVVDGQVTVNELPAWLLLVQFAIAVLYETVMLAVWGRTVGKWVMGLRVARYSDGATPDVARAAQRTVLPNLFTVVALPVVAVGQWVVYGSSAFHPLFRGWHDRYAGTIVVRTR
jgi:uncharacterized RDD family membrane protein YckC